LDVKAHPGRYGEVVAQLQAAGIQVSFFVDPDADQVKAAHECGGDIVEIHTGHYSEARSEPEVGEQFNRIVKAVEAAADLGLGVSAGHGLNYTNIKRFKDLPQIEEYSIGHSIVARAVLVGFEKAVRDMVERVKGF
jgi:pyridoxine 5-phosphate synthase